MTNEKRKVNVYKYANQTNKPHRIKVRIGTGIFHQFGVNYEEFENGPGCFTTAIVEMHDGTIKNIALELIVFIT